MPTPLELAKISEIMAHISTLFDYYCEDDGYYDEYIAAIIIMDIDQALYCFRSLKDQIIKRSLYHDPRTKFNNLKLPKTPESKL